MKRFLPSLAMTLGLSFLYSCKPAPTVSTNPSVLPVVVTNSILADAVKNIGGSQVQITTLVGPDGDPHTYDPSPADTRAVADSKIYFENGLGFEPWSEKLFQSSGTKALRVTADEGIQPAKMEENVSEGEKHASSDEGDLDPHVWNDVENFIHMSENVRDGLIKADPAHADLYKVNAAAWLENLKALDQWVVQQVDSLPVEKRILVTNHDVFGYFARRYRFVILGNALGSLTTESHDPSAAHIVTLVQEIKKTGVKTIFGDFSSNPKLIEQIAQEAGVKIGPKLFVDSLGASGTEGDSYEKMVRYNVSTMVENLK